MIEHVDVVVVGAGISGIGAAYHLQTMCPDRSFVILEARDDIGGTWDLFRYPGVRSDSDMYTLGYSFAPWRGDRWLADGVAILSYHPRDRPRARHRAAHPLPQPGCRCGLRHHHRALDADGRGLPGRQPPADDLQLPLLLCRLLRL